MFCLLALLTILQTHCQMARCFGAGLNLDTSNILFFLRCPDLAFFKFVLSISLLNHIADTLPDGPMLLGKAKSGHLKYFFSRCADVAFCILVLFIAHRSRPQIHRALLPEPRSHEELGPGASSRSPKPEPEGGAEGGNLSALA